MLQFQEITSRQNQQIVNICKLTDKKFRMQERLFRADGFKLLEEMVKAKVFIRTLVLRQDTVIPERMRGMVEAYLDECRTQLISVPSDLFARISDEKAPEGVITVGEYIDKLHFHAIIKDEENILDSIRIVPCDHPILFVEAVQNPENLGALIRSASAFGAGMIVCSADCADMYHPKALRASMGNVFHMPVVSVEYLDQAIKAARLTGRRVFAAALSNDSLKLGQFEMKDGDSVVIGNEGHGLSQGTMDACDACVLIPMSEGTESLNAAVAGGIILWEFRPRTTK